MYNTLKKKVEEKSKSQPEETIAEKSKTKKTKSRWSRFI